jgi:hypothetical protein
VTTCVRFVVSKSITISKVHLIRDLVPEKRLNNLLSFWEAMSTFVKSVKRLRDCAINSLGLEVTAMVGAAVMGEEEAVMVVVAMAMTTSMAVEEAMTDMVEIGMKVIIGMVAMIDTTAVHLVPVVVMATAVSRLNTSVETINTLVVGLVVDVALMMIPETTSLVAVGHTVAVEAGDIRMNPYQPCTLLRLRSWQTPPCQMEIAVQS